MNSERDFHHESVEDQDSIVKVLQTLSQGFHHRKLEFVTGDEKLVLEPAGLIQVEIKVKNHHRKAKLSVKFVWKEESPGKDRRSPLRGADGA